MIGRACTGAALLLAGLAGCTSAEAPAVRDVAAAFAQARDDARCELLAAGTLASVQDDGPCPQVVADLPVGGGEVTEVEVWGSDALVRLTDDTLFLTREAGGWRVSAAACEPTGPDRPYDCGLEGS